ncbi:hypothetical protein ELR50_22105 [Pseudomonas citronellolis]|nr:hypothetical protein ELR50_22105 [Pseudomonas citronellolis]
MRAGEAPFSRQKKRARKGPSFILLPLRTCSRSRELEQNKAKTGEGAQFSPLNEHHSPVFNAVMPTRSRSWAGS